MNKKFRSIATIFMLSLFICIFYAPASMAFTTVYFEADGLPEIAAIQFDILNPSDASVDNFDAQIPGDWLNLTQSGSRNFNAFSLGSPLLTGIVGVFDIDVILGGWVLGDQNATRLTFGEDYTVAMVGSDYIVKAVPIPSALFLLGGGLVGLVGIRRKVMN